MKNSALEDAPIVPSHVLNVLIILTVEFMTVSYYYHFGQRLHT